MKLLIIWLFGVPVAVGVLCAASALWPRHATMHTPVAHSAISQPHLEHVLPSVHN